METYSVKIYSCLDWFFNISMNVFQKSHGDGLLFRMEKVTWHHGEFGHPSNSKK